MYDSLSSMSSGNQSKLLLCTVLELIVFIYRILLAGKKWYDLPATQITDDMKRDLRLLRLRGAYDPKRFYKSFDDTKFPKYFQVIGATSTWDRLRL